MDHKLPESFINVAQKYYSPLGDWTYQTLCQDRSGDALVLGINGGQGTGKSTLAAFLCCYLRTQYQVNAVTLSIDDLYLPKEQRIDLAETVHPLLRVRGVPGTHDVALGCALISGLKSLRSGEAISIPRFDKSTDDRMEKSRWSKVNGPVDLIIFEGWCVGSGPVTEAELLEPINQLEATKDPKGVWRQFVNDNLRRVYPPLFDLIDKLTFFSLPDFQCVIRWRLEQEKKLALSQPNAVGLMSDEQIMEFVQHFERVTQQNLAQLPDVADVLLALDQDHQVSAVRYRN